jgi:flagellar hook-basal body complex protein FliE
MTPLQAANANIATAYPMPAESLAAPPHQAQSFARYMLDAIGEVNSMQQNANNAVEQLMTGGDVNMAEVFTAVQKADVSFRMLMQIRNKMLAAYEEIKDVRI